MTFPPVPKLVSSDTIGVVAGEREIAVDAGAEGEAGDDDLPVTLDGHGVGDVAMAGEVGRDRAAGAEGRVERAVGGVARERELLFLDTGRVGFTDRDDPAVRQQRGIVGLISMAAEVGGGDPVRAEALVEVAERVMTGERKSVTRAGAERRSRSDVSAGAATASPGPRDRPASRRSGPQTWVEPGRNAGSHAMDGDIRDVRRSLTGPLSAARSAPGLDCVAG